MWLLLSELMWLMSSELMRLMSSELLGQVGNLRDYNHEIANLNNFTMNNYTKLTQANHTIREIQTNADQVDIAVL
jgi:hypothetical protein